MKLNDIEYDKLILTEYQEAILEELKQTLIFENFKNHNKELEEKITKILDEYND